MLHCFRRQKDFLACFTIFTLAMKSFEETYQNLGKCYYCKNSLVVIRYANKSMSVVGFIKELEVLDHVEHF